jgi:hypothetical protein
MLSKNKHFKWLKPLKIFDLIDKRRSMLECGLWGGQLVRDLPPKHAPAAHPFQSVPLAFYPQVFAPDHLLGQLAAIIPLGH